MMLSVKESMWLQTSQKPYYDLTEHWAGDDGKGDTYGVNATADFTASYGRLGQRRQEDGTIRETDVTLYHKFTPPSFLDNDIIATTVPLHQITRLNARYHRVDRLLFVPSTDTPNLEWLLLRGNQMNIPELDFTNCVNLKGVDTSICLLSSILLPPRSQDASNYFQYAYIGHYDPIRGGITPRTPAEVIDNIVERAYFSNVSSTDASNTGSRYKELVTDPCYGHLYHGPNKTLPYHLILARDRNWKINHISVEAFNVDFGNSAETKPFDFYSSGTIHDINVEVDTNASWITVDTTDFNSDTQNIQTVNITVAQNTTGSARTGIIRFRKLKTYDNLFEMDYSADIEINQSA